MTSSANIVAGGAPEGAKPRFLAFAADERDVAVLKQFATAHAWPETCVFQGDIKTAAAFLRSNASPEVLLVELPAVNAEQARPLLDALADVCAPSTEVVVTGTVNEYSFYCWLLDLGISNYLLRPLTLEALDHTFQKVTQKITEPPAAAGAKPAREPGKVFAVLGTRGGVGATAFAINIAAVLAELSGKQAAIVDLDPQEGSVALAMDLEPSRGLREALEKPERIDGLFIQRVMHKVGKHLSVLGAEESLQDRIPIHEHSGDALLRELRGSFDVIVLDIPRWISPFGCQCLKQAEHVVAVTELTLLSLRDALRMGDMFRDTLRMKPPVLVANRVGMAPKHEVPVADFEKGVGNTIVCKVPFAPDVYMPINGDIPVLKTPHHPAVRPFYQLAGILMPDIQPDVAEKKTFDLFGKMRNKKEK